MARETLTVVIIKQLPEPLTQKYGAHAVGARPTLSVAAACTLVELGFARIDHS